MSNNGEIIKLITEFFEKNGATNIEKKPWWVAQYKAAGIRDCSGNWHFKV